MLRREATVLGSARFDSHMFSNVWVLSNAEGKIARIRRIPSRHLSHGVLDDLPVEIRPDGWGTVVIEDDAHNELGRIERRSWWGRKWEISGRGFSAELVSDLIPRRWTILLGSQPIGTIAGSPVSYNRLRIDTDLAVPAWALLLIWQVIARPWEAAASPRTLRVVPTPESGA